LDSNRKLFKLWQRRSVRRKQAKKTGTMNGKQLRMRTKKGKAPKPSENLGQSRPPFPPLKVNGLKDKNKKGLQKAPVHTHQIQKGDNGSGASRRSQGEGHGEAMRKTDTSSK